MPTDPRPRRQGTADEAAALAFVTAESRSSSVREAADMAPVAALHLRTEADDPAAGAAADREQRIRRILDFEAQWSSHGGAKARAIRAEFDWSTTRYYQVLDGLLETQEAVRHDPMLVRRLLRLREGR